jgi:hypothetical protein
MSPQTHARKIEQAKTRALAKALMNSLLESAAERDRQREADKFARPEGAPTGAQLTAETILENAFSQPWYRVERQTQKTVVSPARWVDYAVVPAEKLDETLSAFARQYPRATYRLQNALPFDNLRDAEPEKDDHEWEPIPGSYTAPRYVHTESGRLDWPKIFAPGTTERPRPYVEVPTSKTRKTDAPARPLPVGRTAWTAPGH